MEHTLIELDKWADIYEISTFNSNDYKNITIFKGEVELVDIQTDSISEGFKLALEYIERVNPKHELNRHNVEVAQYPILYKHVNVSDKLMEQIVDRHCDFSNTNMDGTIVLEIEDAYFKTYLGVETKYKRSESNDSIKPYIPIVSPNTTKPIYMYIDSYSYYKGVMSIWGYKLKV